MVKKFNELFENNSNDVFDESNYKNTKEINIEKLKQDLLGVFKEWSVYNNGYKPNKETIDTILDDYYEYVLYPDNDNLYVYLLDIMTDSTGDYLKNLTKVIKDIEPEDYKKKTTIHKFKI